MTDQSRKQAKQIALKKLRKLEQETGSLAREANRDLPAYNGNEIVGSWPSEEIGGLRVVNSGELYREPHTPQQKYQIAMVACAGKQAFAAPADAHKAILKFNQRKKGPRSKRGGRMEPYKCSGCGMYHLANKRKRRPKN